MHTTNHKSKPLLTILLVLLFCLLPMLAAIILYKDRAHLSLGRVNHGTLFQMATPAAHLFFNHPFAQVHESLKALGGKWSLVYMTSGCCDKQCAHILFDLKQMHIALNSEAKRVRNVLITGNQCKKSQVKTSLKPFSMLWLTANQSQQYAFNQLIHKQAPRASFSQAGHLFIIDPHVNLVMYYVASVKPGYVFQDLQRLLKVSQIG